MLNLTDASDGDLLALTGLVSALIMMSQSETVNITPANSVRGIATACLLELQARRLLQDSTQTRVLVATKISATEWSFDQPKD